MVGGRGAEEGCVKIALIGAGSTVFTKRLCSDILHTLALSGATIALMDIDPDRLRLAREVVERLVEARGAGARIEATQDRREAVRDADHVITTFLQGGTEAFAQGIEIPERYGVGQCVGDTLGAGGVFKGLRTIPALLEVCRDMDAVARPDALLLNYVNPMAINTWAVSRATGRPMVGLCHSVQGTSRMLAGWLDVPYDEVNFRCAGINHQAFFLSLRRGREDLYPRLREVVERPELDAREPVRIELFKRFGYFVTESSGHASEYVPYFRRSARQIEEELVPRFRDPSADWLGRGRTGGTLARRRARTAQVDRDPGAIPAERSSEYGSYIIEAMETNRPIAINGNVVNRGLIPNLPPGCCVEVPCLVDGAGVQPVVAGDLPPQLAALNRGCINVQELTVQAALTGDRDAVHQALLLDPLTAAAISPDRIHEMVDEMLVAQARWLPQFSDVQVAARAR